MKLNRIQFLRQRLRHAVRQRRVHVIAAQQDMIAHRNALQRNLAGLFAHCDQRKIRRASADIDDQDQIADIYQIAPLRMSLDPVVESGLRLFEKNHSAIAGFLGGLQRKLARDFVERSRHGHQNLMSIERRFRTLRIPGVAQMAEV